MAITTLDGVIAGMLPPQEFYKIGAGTQVIGRKYSTAYAAGYPGVMTAPAGGLQGLGLTSKAGSLSFANPGAGNSYLAKLASEAILPGTLLLCDRLWENSGNSSTSTGTQTHTLAISAASVANPTQITVAAHGQAAGTFVVHIVSSTTTPTINGTWTATYVDGTHFTIPVNVTNTGTATCHIAIPPRDENGTAVGSSGSPTKYGDGVMMAYEVSGLMGAGTPTFNLNYINQDGTAKAATVQTLATTMILGAFIEIPLAAGDTGVRAITDHIKNATQTSGTYHLIMYRVIARVGVPVAGAGYAVDAVTAGLPRMYDNTVPFLLWVPGSTTAPSIISGQMIVTQG